MTTAAITETTTAVREGIARTLFSLALAPFRLTWRVLPGKHPVRIYLDGRAEQVEPSIDEALTSRGRNTVTAATVVLLLAAWCCADALLDVLNVNPLEHIFNL